jgi:hypothetical protein
MLIAFSGFKESGKDTAAQVLVEAGYTKVAFADALRELLLAIDPYVPIYGHTYPSRLSYVIEDIGWDLAKRSIPEIRALMQRTGTEGVRQVFGADAWVNALDKKYPDLFDSNTKYVLTDCRFENEAEFVVHNGGYLYWIDRPGQVSDGHASESAVLREKADYIISNDQSVEEFQDKVAVLLLQKEV